MAVHSAWLVPLAACVVFVMLIFTALGVRRVIILLRMDSNDGAAIAENGSERGAADEATMDSVDEDGRGLSLESSEPGYEVLPPLAAKKPGRTLPKMLLVGPHKQMFPSLSAAAKLAIPGDIIEIRTNGPLVEPGAELHAKQKPKGTPIIIRAGRGFQPVVRGAISIANVDVHLIRIHFATISLSSEDSSWLMEQCSITGGICSTVNAKGANDPLQVRMDRCFFRQGLSGNPRVQLARAERCRHDSRIGVFGRRRGRWDTLV